MIILESIETRNFLNIKSGKLKGFKDFNIIYGPNNCGKSSFLRVISLLREIQNDPNTTFVDSHLSRVRDYWNNNRGGKDFLLAGAGMSIIQEDVFLKENLNVKITYEFNKETINGFASDIKLPFPLSDYKPKMSAHYPPHVHTRGEDLGLIKEEDFYSWNFERNKNTLALYNTNISLLSIKKIGDKVKDIIFCDDLRLQSYKGKDIMIYITEKRLSGSNALKLTSFISDIVDSEISDYKPPFNLLKENLGDFETTIKEQGSGVRSLICMACDILFAREGSIILVDEPELGLNPHVKQKFLKFLLEESGGKQVIIATHDPTFLNPLFFKKENTSVFLYSILNDKFLKVDLEDIHKTRTTFGGYLPHTYSTKPIHLYVEGWTDVLIFQFFLMKYLKKNHPKTWLELFNSVGIFHLGGDYFEHLLCTIPLDPYKKILILDGDKHDKIKDIIEKLESSKNKNYVRFTLRDNLVHIGRDIHDRKWCPIYCLKKKNIEKYLKPKPKNKKECPKVAEKMEEIPEDISKLFKIIFQDN